MSEANTAKFTLTTRQKQIFPLVMLGAFFEGFDFSTINLALPFITNDLSIGIKTATMILSLSAFGALFAFFIVRMGDQIGRKPVFLWSVVAYSILSLLTAFAFNIQSFVIYQFLARAFLVSVWAVGFIIVAEEFPAQLRGRALGMFQAAAAVGAIFPSLSIALMSKFGIGWRGLYIIGALPLIFFYFLSRNFNETEKFEKARQAKEIGSVFLNVWNPDYRKNMVVVSLLWIMLYLVYITAQNFFSYHAVKELGWNQARVGLSMALAYTIALLGYLVAGKLMDRIGRKPTAVIFLLGGSIFTIFTFQASKYIIVLLFMICATFFIGVFTVIGASFTNELFPTAVRANATAWGNNIIGRLGQVAAPALVGWLAFPLGGIGKAVSVIALSPIIAVILIIFFLPETRNREVDHYPAVPSNGQV